MDRIALDEMIQDCGYADDVARAEMSDKCQGKG
jgi:hypothetical protein